MLAGDLGDISAPVARALAANFSFGTDPKRGGGFHSLLFSRHPDGLAFPPPRVVNQDRLVGMEEPTGVCVEEVVIYDAVMCGKQAGDERVVIRERVAGKYWNQCASADALCFQSPEVRCFCWMKRAIVPAKCVEGDQDERSPGGEHGGNERKQRQHMWANAKECRAWEKTVHDDR